MQEPNDHWLPLSQATAAYRALEQARRRRSGTTQGLLRSGRLRQAATWLVAALDRGFR